MLAGLRWVQREIRHFGGDPDKVTIMGHSSGGFTVSLLSVSPRTRGLFHQGVMMSGNAVDDGVLQNDLTLYRRVASAVGCANETKQPWRDWAEDRRRRAVVDCMRKVDMDTLGKTYLNMKGKGRVLRMISIRIWLISGALGRTGPRNDGPDGLFPLPLSKLVASRRPMPALTGTTKKELGSSMALFANASASTIAGLCGLLVGPLGLRNEKAAVLECQRRYVAPYANEQDSQAQDNSSFSIWAQQAERMASTIAFHSACYKDASTLRRKGAKVYLYSFDYEKAGQEDIGPFHAFDLTFLIGVHPFEFDERDKEIQKVYAPLFANFVKYGDPTPHETGDQKWTPLEFPFGFNYYSIDLPQPTMKPDFHKEDVIFWNYELPYLERRGRAAQHTDRALNYMQVVDESDHDHQDGSNGLAKWQAAFWVVLAVLASTVCATLALFVQLSYRRVRSQRAQRHESRSLIRNGEGNRDDYQTFRA